MIMPGVLAEEKDVIHILIGTRRDIRILLNIIFGLPETA
jgi:hypothetical protein